LFVEVIQHAGHGERSEAIYDIKFLIADYDAEEMA